MYVYLYDTFLKDKKHAAFLQNCENRLTDFGIFGKVIRITSFTNPGAILQDEMRRGVKSVVIVGDDDTFARVLSRSAHLPLVFGFIPVGEKSEMAQILGIPMNEGACDVISRRKIERVDVCSMNDRFFFRQIFIEGVKATIVCDSIFSVETNEEAEIAVCNLDVPAWVDRKQVHPQDGCLSVYIRPSKRSFFGKKFEKPTILQAKHVQIRAVKPFFSTIDGIQAKEQYIDARATDKTFSVIVGKERKF